MSAFAGLAGAWLLVSAAGWLLVCCWLACASARACASASACACASASASACASASVCASACARLGSSGFNMIGGI